jgi:sugar lactone lactonase YvrE
VSTSIARPLFTPDSDALRFLPEGPYPLGPNRFSWVAIQHGAAATHGSLNLFDLATGTNDSHPLPGRPGFAFPTDRGNFVVGCERAVGIYAPADRSWTPFIEGIDAHTQNTIINDAVTWDGNLIFGTKDLEFKTKKAGLYLWRGRDRRLFTLRQDQICSNGKCVFPVSETSVELFDIDSPTRQVVAYRVDLETGTASSPRTVVDLRDDVGVPDGMTMTPDGSRLIISLYNPDPAPYGRTIAVEVSSGRIVQEWHTPGSPQATCPQWVESNGKAMLVITTAIEHMPEARRAAAPHAGCLFAVDTQEPWSKSTFGRLAPLYVE